MDLLSELVDPVDALEQAERRVGLVLMDDLDFGKDTMVRWEYKSNLVGENAQSLTDFNELGSLGWELVTLSPYANADGYSPTDMSYFKRPYRICPDCDAKLVVGTETLNSAHDESCYRYGVAK